MYSFKSKISSNYFIDNNSNSYNKRFYNCFNDNNESFYEKKYCKNLKKKKTFIFLVI